MQEQSEFNLFALNRRKHLIGLFAMLFGMVGIVCRELFQGVPAILLACVDVVVCGYGLHMVYCQYRTAMVVRGLPVLPIAQFCCAVNLFMVQEELNSVMRTNRRREDGILRFRYRKVRLSIMAEKRAKLACSESSVDDWCYWLKSITPPECMPITEQICSEMRRLYPHHTEMAYNLLVQALDDRRELNAVCAKAYMQTARSA